MASARCQMPAACHPDSVKGEPAMYARLRRISFNRHRPTANPTRLVWVVGTLVAICLTMASLALWQMRGPR